MMLLIRSRSTGLVGVRRPAAGTGPRPRPSLDLLQRRRRLGVDRRASASACTRRTSRRSATAGGPAARRRARKSWYAGSWMSSTTTALKSARDVERVDLADLDAGDLDVLAGDRRSRRCRRSRAPCRRRRRRAPVVSTAAARDGEQEEDGGDALHQGPGSTRLGSQSSGPRLPLSVYGAEPSAARLAGGAGAARWRRRSAGRRTAG